MSCAFSYEGGDFCLLHSHGASDVHCIGEQGCQDYRPVDSRALKTCPFCGKPAEFNQTGYGTTDGESVKLHFKIRCVKCGSSVTDGGGFIAMNLSAKGEINVWHDDRDKAAAAWNRRDGNV